MKILIQSRSATFTLFRPKDGIRVPLGKPLDCSCGAEFVVEPSDQPHILARVERVEGGEKGSHASLVYLINCPGCERQIILGRTTPLPDEFQIPVKV